MFPIQEQLSAATKSQIEAQLSLLNAFASQALEGAQRIIKLNLSATRAAVGQSSAAAQEMLTSNHPGDLRRFGAPPNLDSVLAYSRELFSIASGTQAALMQSAKEQIGGIGARAQDATQRVAAAVRAPLDAEVDAEVDAAQADAAPADAAPADHAAPAALAELRDAAAPAKAAVKAAAKIGGAKSKSGADNKPAGLEAAAPDADDAPAANAPATGAANPPDAAPLGPDIVTH